MSIKNEFENLFSNSNNIEYFNTADFYKSAQEELGEKAVIKSNSKFSLMLAGISLIALIGNYFKGGNTSTTIVLIILLIVFLINVLNTFPSIILDKEGIHYKNEKLYRWDEIEATYIKVYNGDSPSNYLVIKTKKKISEHSISNLEKDWQELARLIELYKFKFGNKSIVYSVKQQ